MFRVLRFYSGGPQITIAPAGLAAIRERERLGLPDGTIGRLVCDIATVTDRAAAETWPEALDSSADLPYADYVRGNWTGEGQAMYDARILVPAGPVKLQDVTGLRLTLACTPRELVAWRRAWAAEQRAWAAEQRAAALAARVDELEAASTDE